MYRALLSLGLIGVLGGCAQGARPAAGAAAAVRQECEVALGNASDAERWVEAGAAQIRQARHGDLALHYQRAQACVDQALTLQPEHAGARRLEGLIQLNAHRFAEARDGALRLIARDPDDAISWGTLSDAQLELGELAAAIDAAQHMIDLKPNLPSYGRAAHLRWLQGDVAGAKRLYQLAIAAGAGQPDREPRAFMISEVARIFWHEGDYRGAVAGFDLALREQDGYAPALEGKGRVALALGDAATAAHWFERALEARDSVETSWLLGDALTLAGRTEAAAVAYARVIRDGARHDPRTLALYFATRGIESARAVQLARAEYRERRDIYSTDTLAFALFRQGELAEASQLARRALAHGTRDARLLYHAGLIERATTAGSSGDLQLADALRLNPGFDPLLTGAADARTFTHKL